jgi:hypothetical protein
MSAWRRYQIALVSSFLPDFQSELTWITQCNVLRIFEYIWYEMGVA